MMGYFEHIIDITKYIIHADHIRLSSYDFGALIVQSIKRQFFINHGMILGQQCKPHIFVFNVTNETLQDVRGLKCQNIYTLQSPVIV